MNPIPPIPPGKYESDAVIHEDGTIEFENGNRYDLIPPIQPLQNEEGYRKREWKSREDLLNQFPECPVSPRIKEIQDQEKKIGADIKKPVGDIKRRNTV